MVNKVAAEKQEKLKINSQAMNMLPRILILILLGIVLSFLSPYFLTPLNLINVVAMSSIPVILALGETLVVLTGNIDLSLGAIFSMGGVVAAALMKYLGIPVPIAVLGGLATGALMGYFNGLLMAKVKLPSFIGSYALRVAVTGFANAILQGYIVYGFPDPFRFLGIERIFRIPVPIYFALVSFGIVWLILNRTILGRKIYAVGANPEAARLSGIENDRVIMTVYMIAGVFAAMAGILQTSRINSTHAFLGDPMLLPGIAAVVIGGTSMFGGVGGGFGTIIGALIMNVIQNGLNLLGAPSVWQQTIVGGIILLAVIIDQSVRRLTEKRMR
jgi:ribose transport system permease protein